MANFFNQATLNFAGKVTRSNITEGELISGVILTKRAITSDYGPGDNIVYSLTLVNAEATAINCITITDNLGSYTIPGEETAYVPLTYVANSLVYYQNGLLQPTPVITSDNNLVVTGIEIPAGGNVLIIYEAKANDFAPLEQAGYIENVVTITGDCLCETLTANATVPTRDEALLSIAKAICPEVVNCGGEITYTFIVQNNGNIDVDATDNLTISDVFTPALTNITVNLNGQPLTVDTQYTYNETTGEFETLPGAITVPAATFNRNPETGIITTNPGVAIITVNGII